MRQHKLTNVVRVRLTERVVERLDRMADDCETTRSDVIRRLIVENTKSEERQPQTTVNQRCEMISS